MKKLFTLFGAGLLCAFGAAAQATASQQTKASADAKASAKAGNNSADLESGMTFEAQLTKSLDAKKNKPGDTVEAKATQDVKSNGQVVVPKNSRLIGRVTEAKARSEGQSESSLGILFERAITKEGREIPLNVAVQAVAASQAALAAQSPEPELMSSAGASGSGAASGRTTGTQSGGGLVGGATSAAGSTVGAATGAAGSVGQTAGAAVGATTQATGSVTGAAGGLDAAGNLTSNSSGVLGLQGLALQSESAGSAQGSLITSTTRNVHLDSGTRLMLRAMGAASQQ